MRKFLYTHTLCVLYFHCSTKEGGREGREGGKGREGGRVCGKRGGRGERDEQTELNVVVVLRKALPSPTTCNPQTYIR